MLKTVKINGNIVLKSGLQIGGNKDSMSIGGIDNPVIKNPITNLPYIPGSSLKGKIRFLLEHYYSLVRSGDIPGLNERGKENWTKNKIAVIFGHTEHKNDDTTLPTRVIFNDSSLVGAINEDGSIDSDIEKIKQRILSDFVEAKTEVVINRITGTAKQGGLRTMERVPAGTVFDFSISLRVFKEEEKMDHLEIIKKGIKLLQNDSLGGSGSRGSGRIEFKNITIDEAEFDLNTITL